MTSVTVPVSHDEEGRVGPRGAGRTAAGMDRVPPGGAPAGLKKAHFAGRVSTVKKAQRTGDVGLGRDLVILGPGCFLCFFFFF